MHDKIFVDTNLWIYLFSDSENLVDKNKRNVVSQLLEQHPDVTISIQVLNEIVNGFFKKFKSATEYIVEIITHIKNSVEVKLLFEENIIHALNLINHYSLSYYDALIVSVALKAKCSLLYTEDIQHNLLINNEIKVINPFL